MVDGHRSEDSDDQEDEVYLCPICNTRVSSDQTECPGCGAIFVDDDEAPYGVGGPEDGPRELDGEVPLEYRCPACGGSVAEDDDTCPHCGALFVEEAQEPPSPPEAEPARPPEARVAPKAKARTRPPAEPREGSSEGGLTGLRISDRGPGGRTATAATTSREARRIRHSRAVKRLAQRRRLIAKRRMLGLALVAMGFAIYVTSLVVTRPDGFDVSSLLVLVASMVLIILGVLILYNQYHAERHYQAQLQTARIEAALLRERSGPKPAEEERPEPAPKAIPPKRRAPPVRAEKVKPEAIVVERQEVRTKPERRLVTGAAAAAVTREMPPPEPVEPVDMDEPEKVACPNCGYMNRSIFVRCIRCGTELAMKDESIEVETFKRPEVPDGSDAPRPRGGPVPWEARQAGQAGGGGRAAARQAARIAAREEWEEERSSEDRRAAIGVAANFSKLPKNMREELIRTLYKVSDPVVRQDTVSAIAEHYTELPKDIQDLLIDLTDDDDPRVREEVAFEVNRNIDRIPLHVVQTIFGKLARDSENLVREDVVSAIAENFQRLPKETQDLLKELAADVTESVRDEVSFEVAKNSDVIPEKFKSEVKELLRQAGS